VKLPIRVRLTFWYALLLAAIVIALGAFLVLRLSSDLRATIDNEVRSSSAAVTANYRVEGVDGFVEVSSTALPRSGSATQVLGAAGRVLVSYGGAVASAPMLSGPVRAAALSGRGRLVEVHLGRSHQPFRALATAVTSSGHRQLVVVAESLAETEEAVKHILVLLLLAGPVALATAGLVGWWLARKALLPVERMTRKAEQIGIDRLGERLAASNPRDEIGHLAATLNAMLDRLETGMKDKRRLIADASHELRTPLAVMRAEVDVSLRRDALAPGERAALESVQEEIDRMSRSVDNLLTLAQSDGGRLELVSTDVDLAVIARDAAQPLSGLAAAKGVELRIEGEAAATVGDPHRLRLALTNLIDNAIKFTHEGGVVDVTTWRRGEEVGVTVTDTGEGIPVAARERIFERFYRVDGARADIDGSGLGLAICKEIALAHGGGVLVASGEGAGSAFSFVLPAPVAAYTPTR
jgi:heavy metal sensor kinase